MIEIWKPIVGYDGFYEVSNYGRIKSVERNVDGHIFNGTKSTFHKKERIMSVNISRPYKSICLYDGEGNHIETLFHIEVAKAFPEICGEWFEGAVVHHKDCNPSNNKAENLVVLTVQEHLDVHKEKRINAAKKACSISVLQYTLDGEFVKEYESINEAARQIAPDKKIRVVSCNICAVCKGKRRYAYGFVWKYKSGT